MNRIILKSPAKLNLFLKVLNKRPDGFHNIETIIERINLYDRIELVKRKDAKIKIYCDSPAVPKNNSNLAYQAAALLKKEFSLKQGIDIRIKKRIPPASGLGGGSSKAASVLLGLNRLWRLGLSEKELVRYASKIGCDVAFFIHEIPFAYADRRGDRIKPLKAVRSKFWHILVLPKGRISTAEAYSLWDKDSRLNLLTNKTQGAKIVTLALEKRDFDLLALAVFNGFQRIAEKKTPEILKIREELKEAAVKTISVSGKGPAVFGIVSSRKEAEKAKRLLSGWSVFIVKTL